MEIVGWVIVAGFVLFFCVFILRWRRDRGEKEKR
jgi:tellurite resistance protein TehA-like permease